MKIIDKIFRDKKTNSVIYILLAVGIFLILAGSGLGKKEKNTACNTETEAKESRETISDRLETILSQIKGAGCVSVMVVTDNNGRKNFGYDNENGRKKTVILNKSGGEEALVSEEFMPDIRGVIIVADGGGKASVREALMRGARTVLGIEPHKIEVFERNENQ